MRGGPWFGGDYNPEQWPAEVWTEDADLMRRAGVNLVSLGVFAWSRLEPAPGRFTFDWLDRAMDLLAGAGVGVALATPTASPPPWFSLAHPDALPVTAGGVRLSHGSRDTYCASAPAYRDAARRIAGALADRYAGHPALAMWHVHNEYGTICHCDHAAGAFRRWLRRRYGGLDALNEAWTTAFWSQHYADWSQILPPRATQYLPNPAQVLDFRRFWSDELLRAYTEQRDLLRAATPGTPVTTNFVFGGWVPVDHARWAAEVDVVAVDHYPADPGAGAPEEIAFAANLARCWGDRHGRPWLLVESAPNLIYTGDRMHTKEPGRLKRHALGYVARGSRGAMFFQWRAPRGGAERWHSALVPHAGADSRVYREAVDLGAALGRLGEAAGEPVAADVAVLWDAPSWWALQAPGLPSTHIDYLDAVRAVHRAFWRAGSTVDFAVAGTALDRYRMVVVPNHYLMPDAVAERLRAFAAGGGHLVVTYLSGIADECGRVRLGGYPGALRDVLGIRVEEFHPQPPDATVPLSGGLTGRLWRETVYLAGAAAVEYYTEDGGAEGSGAAGGGAAITRHGTAWYVSTALDDDSYRRLLTRVATEAGVAPAPSGTPAGVEVVRRGRYLFLLNHTAEPAEIPATGVELLTGEPVTGCLTVPPGEVAVLRQPGGAAVAGPPPH
ncbi:beta-galactosidase [Rhizomonospora bruguierae]|uniref:beta-galactosidase n=1 Tax=Rhizomonospora bruguierae TaxID=1581705 RepID=UPI0020C18186|nr:beta-galactosidase [Micromonospora sp. NBRC 107566]